MTDSYDAALAYATERGRQDGTNAAGWYVQDTLGGSAYGPAGLAARNVLAGIEDGDPAVLDTFPSPDLSGQWADSLTGPQLVEDAWWRAGIGAGESHTERYADYLDKLDAMRATDSDAFTDLCDAYETAYTDAVSDEIARAAREVLA